MNNLFIKIQMIFNNLNKHEKVAAITILSLLIGTFFFISGISIGEALFKITH